MSDLTTGLRRLAEDTVVPPIDPEQEQRLLAAFDKYHAAPRRRSARPWAAAAGLLAAAAMLAWAVRPQSDRSQTVVQAFRPAAPAAPVAQAFRPAVPAPAEHTVRPATPVRRPNRPAAPPAAQHEFVAWPGAGDLPRLESGQLMRVELPASVVVSLGLRPRTPLRDDGVVQTDVLVGQDGYARAVRLVK